MDGWRRWRDAMHEALYGADGFYRHAGAPGTHFRTAAHVSPQWAAAFGRLAEQVGGDTFVEIGAGGGELLRGLAELLPERWRLVGVDVAPRPPDLPDRVAWMLGPPASFDGVLVAVEWLDVVPVDVVELTDDGTRYVEVAPDGTERVAGPVDGDDAAWLKHWWPLAERGDRAEVGRPRDDSWSEAVRHVSRGVAVAVDYSVDRRRDVAGTLTGYREGRQLAPVPDGSCDITAHVLMESVAAAATHVHTKLLTQREALRALGVSGALPSYDGDPRAYLAEVQRATEAAELLDPRGLGGFTWLVQARGVPLPF